MSLYLEQEAPLSEAVNVAIGDQINALRAEHDELMAAVASALSQIEDAFSSIVSQLSEAASGEFPQILIRSSAGEVIGWIGSNDGYEGGWFKRLYVGGTDPTNSPLVTDSNGRLTITLAGASDRGALSVKDAANNEILWIGKTGSDYGLWAKSLWVGGTGTSSAPLFADSVGVVTIGKNGYVSLKNNSNTEIGWLGYRDIGGTPYNGGWVKEWRIGGTDTAGAKFVSNSSGDVSLTNATLTLTAGNVTINIDGTNYIRVSDSGLQYRSSIGGSTTGVYHTSDPDNYAYLFGGTSVGFQAQYDFNQGKVLMLANAAGSSISMSNSVGTTYFELTSNSGTATAATAGARTLPSNPDGFLPVTIAGGSKKIPYYNA